METLPSNRLKNIKESSIPKFLVVVCGIFGILFAMAAVGLLVRLLVRESMDVTGLLIFAVCVAISSICFTVVCGQTPDFFNKALKKRAVHLRDVWKVSHIAWLISYFMLSGFAMLFLILTIYIGAVYPSDTKTISKMLCFSVLSLFLDFLNLFINPKKIAKGYRLAYEGIDKALEPDAKMSKAEAGIVESIKNGEKIIGNHTFD